MKISQEHPFITDSTHLQPCPLPSDLRAVFFDTSAVLGPHERFESCIMPAPPFFADTGKVAATVECDVFITRYIRFENLSAHTPLFLECCLEFHVDLNPQMSEGVCARIFNNARLPRAWDQTPYSNCAIWLFS